MEDARLKVDGGKFETTRSREDEGEAGDGNERREGERKRGHVERGRLLNNMKFASGMLKKLAQEIKWFPRAWPLFRHVIQRFTT